MLCQRFCMFWNVFAGRSEGAWMFFEWAWTLLDQSFPGAWTHAEGVWTVLVGLIGDILKAKVTQNVDFANVRNIFPLSTGVCIVALGIPRASSGIERQKSPKRIPKKVTKNTSKNSKKIQTIGCAAREARGAPHFLYFCPYNTVCGTKKDGA